jgi:hypothetical protein
MRLETIRAEFQAKRNNPTAFAMLLQQIVDSDYSLWSVARPAAGDKPLDVDECAMIAQLVAPHLAWRPPGSVRLRQELAQ